MWQPYSEGARSQAAKMLPWNATTATGSLTGFSPCGSNGVGYLFASALPARLDKNRPTRKIKRNNNLCLAVALREKTFVQTRFLLGPAGSGKTFRCLAEMRAELVRSAEGAPLLLLAPKQATFQLERQLLGEGTLPGYTRLQILSFERLAQFVLNEFTAAPPRLLGDEGRLMVLRALLAQKESELKLFRASARLPGFAQQLSLLLRELQRHQLAPERLLAWASRPAAPPQLRDKLNDIALLLHAYLDWLQTHELQDANCLLDLATQVLLQPIAGQKKTVIHFAGLWLDGFAEMTPQELNFLAALVPQCEQATLAFCLEHVPDPDGEQSWLSTGSVVAQTVRRCQARLAALPDCRVIVEQLARDPIRSRFAGSPALAHLEAHWSNPQTYAAGTSTALRLACCANPEAEATLAAQEILRHVRAGGRYRECAVLARSLEGYHDVLRRVFTRHEIPFFLDRREPVAHHPLAELTRFALRTAAFGWRQEDWFGALKSGLVPADETELDQLENEALARGWEGRATWQQPLRFDAEEDTALVGDLEKLRQRLVPPFSRLADALTGANPPPTGAQLAAALRKFWHDLNVAPQLEEWSSPSGADSPPVPGRQPAAIHLTVYQQMNEWLDHLELAFTTEPLPLRDWLPILEAGLGGLSVGVIPPVLDEVLIGAIDRSRNPDLQLALVLGVNETVFPAPPTPGVLLTDVDREALAALDPAHFFLGPDARQRLGHERYLGYIACTRARKRLVLTCAAFNETDQKLNPSPFFAHLQRLFPSVEIEEFRPSTDWLDSEHLSDLIAPILQSRILLDGSFFPVDWPVLTPLRERLNFLTTPGDSSLPPALVEKLYGPALRTSVTSLEKFAECPFRFFVHAGLRARERKRFEADDRATGLFQHEILKQFHERLRGENKRWRDISPAKARQRVRQIADELLPTFGGGVFVTSERDRFIARQLASALEDFVETLVGWMAQYEFDPVSAELRFSDHAGDIPAWTLPLSDGRQLVFQGVIDRVDLFTQSDGSSALCVVMDYKSGTKKIDARLLANGVQLQLPAYLSALRQLADPQPVFGVAKLIPAGVFYVSLRGHCERGANRTEVLTDQQARTLAYRHSGRFDAGELAHFDKRPQPAGEELSGDQFNYTLTAKKREIHKRSKDPMPSENFLRLLDTVETQLKQMGERIFSGEAKVDPYQHGAKKPCEFCDYRTVCRIDPWTHAYRALRDPAP